jgi:hypothetical protein
VSGTARILLDADEADRLLDRLGNREFYEAAADDFIRLLHEPTTAPEPDPSTEEER